MADLKETQEILFGGMDDRNEQSEKEAIKSVIDAIKENAGPDPQEQVQALENALYGMADGFFQEREKRRQAEAETATIQDTFRQAWAEYNAPGHDRWEQKAKAFFSCLGLNSKKKKKVNKLHLFHEYMELIMGGVDIETWEHREPMSKQDALEVLRDRHGLSHTQSVIEQLREHIRKRKKAADQQGDSYNFKNILPGRSTEKYK